MANGFGNINDPRKHVSIEWDLEDYFSMPQKADKGIESPTFHCLNADLCLKLYPNGERLNKSVEYLNLYIMNEDSETDEIAVNYVLGIRSGNGTPYKKVEKKCTIKRGDGYGHLFFLKRSELLSNRSIIVPNGALTIFFVLIGKPDVNDASSQTVSVEGSKCVSRDFLNLLQSKQNSDVIIRLKCQEFRAHKLILGARSSVFAAMFRYNMKENASGVVNIEDCEPDAFQEFLLFVYTGQVKELSSENVFQLCSLADKYDVNNLKEICIDFMKDNLNLDIACKVLEVADKHNEEELKKSAKKLIINNIKELLPTEQWIIFLRESPNLATELLMTVIPDRQDSIDKLWRSLQEII